MPQRAKKLLDQVRDAIQLKHYAYNAEQTDLYWAKRFVLYHSKCHPLENRGGLAVRSPLDSPTTWG